MEKMEAAVEEAAGKFGKGTPVVTPIGEGLIHKTWKVDYTGNEKSPSIVLQCINSTTFPQPEKLVYNYRLLEQCLSSGDNLHIAPLVPTQDGEWLWKNEAGQYWRATQYIENSITGHTPATEKEAYNIAQCFGAFTRSLLQLDISKPEVVLPGFHDLSLRYRQFEQAIKEADIKRLLKATHVIAELRQRKKLVDFYEMIRQHPGYPMRVMHHDSKMSNILLDAANRKAICPVDLDTVMPGLYFSDAGDMIRSMAGTVDENSTRWEDIAIRGSYYKAILQGYLSGINNTLTSDELDHIHHAGIIMLYMQCLRYVTDFLNNDVYYKTSSPEQNLNRALNQLIMLEKLEEFLQEEYDYVA